MRKNKKYEVTFTILIWGILTTLGVAIFLLPQNDFSYKENRPLASLPSPTVSSLIDGRYFGALGEFYRDQLPFRDALTSLYSLCELSLGKSEVNGALPTRDAIVALPRSENSEKISENLAAIHAFDTLSPSLIYIPPRTCDAFSSAMPSLCEPLIRRSHTLLSEDTRQYRDQLLSNSGDIYYRTDHHWTTDGAYLAYTQICDRLGLTPYERDFFERYTVSREFLGTSYSSSALPRFAVSPDSVVLYRYKGDTEPHIYIDGKPAPFDSFYDLSALKEKDKYRIFLGGNYAHLQVNSGDGKPRLLMVKDSFANSLIPFLALHFNIEAIDPRYCTPARLEEIMNGDFEQSLFLLSLDTLSQIDLK